MIQSTVYKEVLPNGLVMLVLPRHDIPKVSIQLFYGVGAKNEGSGLWSESQKKFFNEYGIAHFIEHMIFKGTDTLSESDINTITSLLSGSCNAFTSQDYTGYLFDMPAQHWYECLPIMADCMKNCTFKQEHINSELKAVVQEIKMYNDDYLSTLMEKMMGSIFQDHPYHNPIIGYKHDLWNLKRDNLVEFYQKHYGPNNAVLVVVGDVAPTDVFKRAEQNFGSIEPLFDYKKQEFAHTIETAAQNVIIHRDIQQPILLYCWEVPGAKMKKDYLLDVMSWVVGAGKGARLYNKLVTEQGIATELQSFVHDLFDASLFYIYVQPRSLDDEPIIRQAILKEIEDLCSKEISDAELRRAQKKTEMDFLNLSEDNQKQAYLLGKTYLVTSDENYLFNYCNYKSDNIKQELQDLFRTYFVPLRMHTGQVLAFSEQEKDAWIEEQIKSDEEDTRTLNAIIREDVVEEASYANNLVIEQPQPFVYPKPKKFVLNNGLTVLYAHKPGLGKLDIILDLQAKHYYDPVDKQGLSMFMTDLLQEGTTTYSAQDLALELESHGMELNTFPGQFGMTMLSADAQKGLRVLADIIMNPSFEHEAVERVRNQLLAELKLFWDTPQEFSGQLIREAVYKNHPYAQNVMGDAKALASITRQELVDAHKKYITPRGARIALVGDLTGYDVEKLLNSTLGAWQGEELAHLAFPQLQPLQKNVIKKRINRDQVVLCYGGLSVSRTSPDYDHLLIFDQIFTGGLLGSMNSRLYHLREQTGLFYSIGGSLLAGVSHEPGMVYIKTIVSNDRLEEAEKAIEAIINQAADTFTQEELEEAQLAIINSLVDNFASNRQTAATFIFMEKYNLPENYFDIRINQLVSVDIEEIKAIVKKYLTTDRLIKIEIGRV